MSERAHEWAVLVLAGFLLAFVACTGDDAGGDVEGDDEATELEADFDWDYDLDQTQGTACSFATTYFFDRSSGEPTAWLWEFPDGSTSTEQNPVVDSRSTRIIHEDGTGDMSVELTITRDGETATISQDVFANHC